MVDLRLTAGWSGQARRRPLNAGALDRMCPHLIFDLDGTISDPAIGIARSINYALSSFGYPALPEKSVSHYIGPPVDETFAQITASSSSEHISALVGKYRERYAEVGYSENVIYPGVVDALERLVGRGAPLGLCTLTAVPEFKRDVGKAV